jgi:hypothetical protein
MTPNHHPDQPQHGYTEAAPGSPSGVIRLDHMRQRKRLHSLEATRRHLATIAAQQRSHRLDDAEETFNLQLVTEAAILEEFPQEYDDLFATWLENDRAAEHPTGVLSADCGICRSIATSHHLNLEPPQAA